MKRAAFTLTELLVVIGILALLAAILLPVFFSARSKSRTASCAANLRQIGVALQSYVSDYDGTYPPTSQLVFTNNMSLSDGVDWRDLLLPYINGNFPVCPDRIIPSPQELGGPKDTTRPQFCGYACNVNLAEEVSLNSTQTVSKGLADNVVKTPALLVAVFDARTNITAIVFPDKTPAPNAEPPGATRHQDGANYLFADGHVKWFLPSCLAAGISEKGDGVHPGFGL